MRALHRFIASLVVIVGCEGAVDKGVIEQEAKAPSCVLDANKWQGQLIWPVSTIVLGTTSYTEAQARSILAQPIQGNGLVDLAKQLIAAKLNFAMGASAPDFVSMIAAADAMIGTRVVPPVGTGFLPTSLTNSFSSKLGAFNKGSKNAGPCVGPQADLAIAKTTSNPTPDVGDTFTFTIVVTNLGPVTATGVRATDVLPAGLSFVAATASQGTFSIPGVWDIGTVNLGAPATLALTVTLVTPDPLTNTATIVTSDQFDPNTANNTASITVTPARADVALAKTVDDPTPNVGDTVTFTITITNAGPSTATGIIVTDNLPPGLTFLQATPSAGTYDVSNSEWFPGTLAAGQDETLAIRANVVSPTPMTNTATITDADRFDPDTANNTASATVTPQNADLALAKTANDTTPDVGETIVFTITLTNHGPDAATSARIADVLPVGLTFVSATPSKGTYTPVTGIWDVGSVDDGVSETLLIAATVATAGTHTNTALLLGSDQFDPNGANDAATATITTP